MTLTTPGGALTAGVGVSVEAVAGAFPGTAWEPIGPIITTAKLNAAGATTRHVETGLINVSTPSIFRKPAWWTGDPTWGEWILLFGGHFGLDVLAAHTDDLADPDSWIIEPTPVMTYETAIDLAADAIPDGVITPAAPTSNSEQIGSASVWVDEDNQQLLTLMRVGVDTRANLSSLQAVGFTTTDLETWTIRGPVGGSKNLGFAGFAMWANPPGYKVGTHRPIVTRPGTLAENGRLERGKRTDWVTKDTTLLDGSVTWATFDPTNEAGLGGDITQRHLAGYWEKPGRLRVYWSSRGASPERIESALLDASSQDMRQWRTIAGSHRDDRYPLLDWEGFGTGGVPSPPTGGVATQPMEQLRDPFVFDDGTDKWLTCAAQAEFAIGLYRWGTP